MKERCQRWSREPSHLAGMKSDVNSGANLLRKSEAVGDIPDPSCVMFVGTARSVSTRSQGA